MIYFYETSGLLKNFLTSTVCVIYPRPYFVPRRPNRHHLHIPCWARGWEHKSEEYLNLTLLSNASWPTLITVYPAPLPRAQHSLSMLPLTRGNHADCSKRDKSFKVQPFPLSFFLPAFRLPVPGLKPRVSRPASMSSRDKECIQDEIMWRGGGWGGCSQRNLWECTFC